MAETVRKAKEYLCRIGRCDDRIKTMLEEVDNLYDMITKITPTLKQDVVTGGGSQDKIGDAVSKIVDLKNEINRRVDYYVDLKREADALLDQVDNHLYYIILYRRYMLGESFEFIAAEMNYTYRWVCILHGRALEAFAKVMPDKCPPEAGRAEKGQNGA